MQPLIKRPVAIHPHIPLKKLNWDGIYAIFDLQFDEKLRLQDINKTRANSAAHGSSTEQFP
jgi:hypothetical protein